MTNTDLNKYQIETRTNSKYHKEENTNTKRAKQNKNKCAGQRRRGNNQPGEAVCQGFTESGRYKWIVATGIDRFPCILSFYEWMDDFHYLINVHAFSLFRPDESGQQTHPRTFSPV